jgi:competence protein ComGC
MNTITNSANVLSLYYQNRLNRTSESKTAQTRQFSEGQFTDPLEELVASGTITEDQEEAIREALQKNAQPPARPMGMEAHGNPMKDTLSALVEDETITEDQKTAIEEALEALRKSGGAKEAGGKEALESVLNGLVEDGTITQDQMDAITGAMEKKTESMPLPPPPPPGGVPPEISESLSGLTGDGTITEDQEEAILSFLESYQPDGQEDSSPLDTLAENGTITEEQKEKIQAAFGNAMKLKEAKDAYDFSAGISGPADLLKESGILSDEQARSVNQALYGAFGRNSRYTYEL